MSLTCVHKQVITVDDPAALLAPAITCGAFAGVPTVMIKGDCLVREFDAVRCALESAAKEAREHDSTAIPFARKNLARARAETQQTLREDGLILPHVILNGGRQALVVLPADDLTAEKLAGIYIDPDRVRMDAGVDPFALRYTMTCHELAHVAGADEPQADKIAALFCRRAFNHMAPSVMLSDLRALAAAFDSCEAQDNELPPAQRDDARRRLHTYGWKTVRSIDSAHALPAETAPHMTDSAILALTAEQHEDVFMDTLLMTRILHGRHRADKPIPSSVQHMVDRFVHARARLTGGGPAYKAA